jgi:hypothetical protein
MKIMEKQATNSVCAITIADGTLTLEERPRDRFPDSVLAHNSNDGQGQQSLEVCKCTMNRGERNMARNVINQSQIRCELGTFKQFKSAEQMKFYRQFCSKGWSIYFPYFAAHLEPAWHMAWR